MNSKFMISLGVALLVLVGIWLGMNWWRGYAAKDYAVQTELDLPGSADEMRRIVITDGEKKLAMQRKDGIWFLETQNPLGTDWANEADATTLASILNGFPAELVSANADRHSELGIDDDQAIRVAFYKQETDEQPEAVLMVSSTNKTLVREPDSQEVYRWSRELSRVIYTDSERWIQPTPTPEAEASSAAEVSE